MAVGVALPGASGAAKGASAASPPAEGSSSKGKGSSGDVVDRAALAAQHPVPHGEKEAMSLEQQLASVHGIVPTLQ
jgi:hypothetical protein